MYNKYDSVYQIINKDKYRVYIVAPDKKSALERLNKKKIEFDKELIIATNKGLVRDVLAGFFTQLSNTLAIPFTASFTITKDWEFSMDFDDGHRLTGTTVDFSKTGDLIITLTKDDQVEAAWLYPSTEVYDEIISLCKDIINKYKKNDILYCVTVKNPLPEEDDDTYVNIVVIASNEKAAIRKTKERYTADPEQIEEVGNAEEFLSDIFQNLLANLPEFDEYKQTTDTEENMILEHIITGNGYEICGSIQQEDDYAQDMAIWLKLEDRAADFFDVFDPDIVFSIISKIENPETDEEYFDE